VGVDLGRVASSALAAFLHDDEPIRDDAPRGGGHRLRSGRALLLGAAAGTAGRVAYRRVRSLELEQVALALQRRLRASPHG
jgi:hypothetical protein